MLQILTLLKQGILTTLLDVDNAVYMTSMVEHLDVNKQRQAIMWGILAEFIGRVLLISFLGTLLSENEVLFTLLKVKFTPESISLFVAGLFLIYKSSRELYAFFKGKEKRKKLRLPKVNLPSLIIEMTCVNLILSIDTIIVVSARAMDLSGIILIFLISAIIRLGAIDKVAQLIQRYPSINIVILIFLILIGCELLLQGLWSKFPEKIFNTVLVLAIIAAIIERRERA